jgi:hypothetical protein
MIGVAAGAEDSLTGKESSGHAYGVSCRELNDLRNEVMLGDS